MNIIKSVNNRGDPNLQECRRLYAVGMDFPRMCVRWLSLRASRYVNPWVLTELGYVLCIVERGVVVPNVFRAGGVL